MFDNLAGLGYGLVTFAIIIGVGTIVLVKFGSSVAECATLYTYNETQGGCVNSTNEDLTDPANDAWATTNYLTGQLGESGLAGWAPAIIALVVGMLFLGIFLARKGRKV